MTRATASCPSCGAPVEFVSAASVQTTCRYCTSVLVRTDLDLRAVGVKSTVPPSVSPIRLGTRGSDGGRRFQVVGRLVYAYERGRWNEWHLAYDDGGTGWLSDAQAEYAITAQVPSAPVPTADQARPGTKVTVGGEPYTVGSLTRARYAGTEGELPFERWEPGEMSFADLRGEGGRFATLDYSENPPLLFAGRWVAFDDLALSELREPEEVKAAALTVACPNCGGSVTVHAAGLTVSVVCAHCRSVLDARSSAFKVLQTYHARLEHTPKIPLGTPGTLNGRAWEVIGFQVRSIRVEGRDYPWDEYLLFSPRYGFCYLTEYQGHWNRGETIRGVPRTVTAGMRPAAELDGRVFRHFQRAKAETTFVLGEFPWEVRAGDRAKVSDFVAPPYMLSSEETEGETTWTLSEYVPGAAVWKAFGMKGSPPSPRGVYANEPAPATGVRGKWAAALAMLALLVALAMVHYSAGGGTVGTPHRYGFDPLTPQEQQAQVIGPLVLGGRTSNVEVDVEAVLNNSWAYFDLSLADSAGQATQFGKEVSYYQGVEDGERWSEGSPRGSVRVPSVPPGRYWLRVEPQGELPYSYEVKVRRDVPMGWMYLVAALLLLLPPGLATLRSGLFETQRWAESDYAPND
ncbi:DUF4178 domain-containing protein [Longimicrobium sp.]|uniref:DUF4178 domain-containing protein n=1 Tax=Longimicrobium sp. TaxID=2029185 RepID=UPI002C7FC166|nr:DUF4178 domain-containing protein [Longimicrobium sp.]HSU13574.1 DUF4178 domain-containing protein [Longimicrobium sp.]